MKKIICKILFAICGILIVLSVDVSLTEDVAADEMVTFQNISKDNNVNVLLLLDVSGSMNETDSKDVSGQYMTLSLASQFIDLLDNAKKDEDLKGDISLQIDTFSESIETVYKFKSLDQELNIASAKKAISNITYNPVGTGASDIGTAVWGAANEINSVAQNNGNEINAVVMFTDGFSERNDAAATEKALNEAYTVAKDNRCEFYIIGLNPNGNIKKEGIKRIEQVADETQIRNGISETYTEDIFTKRQKVNYLIAKKAEEIQAFLIGVSANLFGAVSEYVKNNSFMVEDPLIRTIVVYVYAESEIEDIKIKDPEGHACDFQNETHTIGGTIYEKEVIIDKNILQGQYKTEITCSDDASASAVAVKFLTIGLKVEGDSEENKVGLERALYVGKVKVTPIFEGKTYQENSFLQTLTKESFIVDGLQEYQLSYQQDEGALVGYFPILEDKDYQVAVTLEAGNIQLTDDTCIINSKHGVKKEPDGSYSVILGEKLRVNRGETRRFQLSEIFPKMKFEFLNGDIQYSDSELSDDKQVAAYTIDESDNRTLVISGKTEGSANFTAKAQDENLDVYIIQGRIEVGRGFILFEKIRIALIAALALVSAVVIHVIRDKNKKRIIGEFILTAELITSNGSADKSYKAGQQIELPNRARPFFCEKIHSYPNGKKITLYQLMKIASNNFKHMDELNDKSSNEFANEIKNNKGKLKKCVFVQKCSKDNQLTYVDKQKMKQTLNKKVFTIGNLKVQLSFKPEFDTSHRKNRKVIVKAVTQLLERLKKR